MPTDALLSVLDDAAPLMGALRDRMAALLGEVEAAVRLTAWRSPAAERFHEGAEELRALLAAADADADVAADALARLHTMTLTDALP